MALPVLRAGTSGQHAERPLSTLALISDGKRILALTDDPVKMIEGAASSGATSPQRRLRAQ